MDLVPFDRPYLFCPELSDVLFMEIEKIRCASFARSGSEDLLECLWEEEALLHVVVAGWQGVNVPDPGEARVHSAVLLQGLTGDTEAWSLFWIHRLQSTAFNSVYVSTHFLSQTS